MSQPSASPPPIPPFQGAWTPPARVDVIRGPVGGPPIPYQPGVFSSLYLWYAILLGVGLPCCLLIIGIPAVIAAVVLQYILLYKAWNQIQDGYQRTGPDAAVGLCFVPFFNFYWVFIAYRHLAIDMNAYARRYGIAAPHVSEGLALAWCILLCGLAIPYLNFLIAIAVAVVSFFFLHQIKIASAAIAHAKYNAAVQAGLPRS
jgi:hypothetical protein